MSDMVGNPEDRFSRDAPQLISLIFYQIRIISTCQQRCAKLKFFVPVCLFFISNEQFISVYFLVNYHLSRVMRKSTFVVSDRNWARDLTFRVNKVEGMFYVAKPMALVSCPVYHAADLPLCFRICKKQLISWRGSFQFLHTRPRHQNFQPSWIQSYLLNYH